MDHVLYSVLVDSFLVVLGFFVFRILLVAVIMLLLVVEITLVPCELGFVFFVTVVVAIFVLVVDAVVLGAVLDLDVVKGTVVGTRTKKLTLIACVVQLRLRLVYS